MKNSLALYLLLCGMVLAEMSLFAQSPVVRLDAPGSHAEEVSIAINPLNPDNLVAGSNLDYVYHSFDGGATWEQHSLPPGTWGDPSVIFDRTGRAYIANLVFGWDAIIVRHSDDGGKSWSEAVKLFGPSSDSARAGNLRYSSLQDKEWLATDLTEDSPYRGFVYAAWTDFTKYGSTSPRDSSVIVFARSTDRGESFDPYVRVSDRAGDAIDSDNTMEGAVPAVGPEGEIYLTWSGPEGIYFDRSFDGGVTWGEDRIISDQPGGWDISVSGIMRANGLPVTATDISSSPHRGNVYVNWVDQRNGDPDVFIMRSGDHGSTWTNPIRVNDDEPGNGKDQFFTWMTVDPITGDLAIVYHDRRQYAGDSTDVYLARSTDGGSSFRNERISSVSFYPTPFVFFGDYNGIAAYDGRIRPIWTQLDQGELSIHTALIDAPTSASGTVSAPGSVLGVRGYPNPVSAATESAVTFTVHIPTNGMLRFAIHDLVGREVAVIAEEHTEAGTRMYSRDVSALPAGIYICRVLLQSGMRSSAATTLVTILH
ncbi:MAG: glycosyl hydrolase [Bacteroidetes bacterium]|nr:glycosyl hydrolase [Bacteroidota bacterium]